MAARPDISFELDIVTVGGKEGQRLAQAQAASILEILDWVSQSPQLSLEPPKNPASSDKAMTKRERLGHLRPVPANEAGIADWIVAAARGSYLVSSLVPTDFANYARLFHPAQLGRQDDPAEVRWFATFEMPLGRTMLLLRGPLADTATVSMVSAPFEQSPSLWWPADRAWCVATDVDLVSSCIGADDDCIDAILTEPLLETWRVNPADRIDGESDPSTPPHRTWTRTLADGDGDVQAGAD